MGRVATSKLTIHLQMPRLGALHPHNFSSFTSVGTAIVLGLSPTSKRFKTAKPWTESTGRISQCHLMSCYESSLSLQHRYYHSICTLFVIAVCVSISVSPACSHMPTMQALLIKMRLLCGSSSFCSPGFTKQCSARYHASTLLTGRHR